MLEGPVMPASLFSDMGIQKAPMEETNTRTLEIALELSRLTMVANPEPASPVEDPSAGLTALIVPEEPRPKKSQNMTECVPVPSSEHVAEIVGRQVTTETEGKCRFSPDAVPYLNA
ncbi:unnamed protein product [Notodromas monacha]|uniref:Uncharacterized protein n=1 Tax=Notodromas monacha TaxID=399045 RepID=A0A7R9BQ93_9CRUS|nr:unnamed protein product [Notodromas monacha]CAG0918349.1 unnamed protein product [Notodromas monacha]